MRELSVKEKRRKCSKCGSSPADDPTVNLHRFPQPNKANKSRCELWAKFCFPNESWHSLQFQNKLFTENKMLCDKHFKRSSFAKPKRLCKFTVPANDCNKESNRIEQEHSKIEMVIKNEPDETIDLQEHFLETEHKQAKSSSPQKSLPIKRRAEENVETEPLKKTKDTNASIQSQENFDDTYDEWSGLTTKYNRYDECELYGKLLTKKLKNYVVYERNILMFKIDGLLIEHPPGFDTSTHTYSIDVTPQKTSNKTTRKVSGNLRKKSKKASTSKSTMETFSYSIHSNNTLSSSPSKIKRELSQEAQTKTQIDNTISSISTPLPLKFMNKIQNKSIASAFSSKPVKVTSSIPNVPVKVTSNIQFQPIKVTGSIPNQTIKVTSCIPSQPVKVTSSTNQAIKVISNIPNQPVKVTTSTSCVPNEPDKVTSCIPNEPVEVTSCIPNELVNDILKEPLAPVITSGPLPSHLPLHITIPQTKIVPTTKSKIITTPGHPKGKILILKSKSAKYVASSQPPILITVPSLSTGGYSGYSSTQCDMNSLEQLSSIAVDHASQTQHLRYDPEEDFNDVSHEVVL